MTDIADILLDPDIKEQFEIHRQQGKYFTGGQWVETVAGTSTAYGSVQPTSTEMSGDIDNSTGGYIPRESITIYSPTLIIGLDSSTTPDKIIWKNKEYEVNSVKDWSSQGFYKAVAQFIAVDDGTTESQTIKENPDIYENNIVEFSQIPTAIIGDAQIFNPAGELVATIANEDLTILGDGTVQIEAETDYHMNYLKVEYEA